MLCIFTFELLVKQCKCNATRGFSLISKGIKSLCSFTVIFIYIDESVFVCKVFFVHYFLGKASPQISKNSILWIIFPDYMHSTKLVYVRCYFEAAIASIFIFFKPCSDEIVSNENVLNVLDSLKKCIQKKQYSKRENCFNRE